MSSSGTFHCEQDVLSKSGNEHGEKTTGPVSRQHSPVGSRVGGQEAKAPFSTTDERLARSALQIPDEDTSNCSRKAAHLTARPLAFSPLIPVSWLERGHSEASQRTERTQFF